MFRSFYFYNVNKTRLSQRFFEFQNINEINYKNETYERLKSLIDYIAFNVNF